MLEKFLTMPEQEFASLLRSSDAPIPKNDGKRDAYRYVQVRHITYYRSRGTNMSVLSVEIML